MVKGLGKALQEALVGTEKSKPEKPSSATLFNSARRRILEYLCLRPFSKVGRISTDLKLSPSSVVWHLRNLVTAGYVSYRPETGIYYPKDLVDIEDAELFVLMQIPRKRRLLKQIIESPGISQTELATVVNLGSQTVGKISMELAEIDLVTQVQDGRLRRWYPTNLLNEKQENQRVRSRAYVDSLLERFENEGQTPQVLRRSDTELQIRLGRGREHAVLSLPLDPYGAIIL